MFYKKKIIAMLLAGGQGSRLCDLTDHTAKPAVSFGGKYRIVDFPLSNCINSGIDTVGVVTQYQPQALNEYIGNGAPWDLDRARGGLTVLPPYQGKNGSDWYRGTANAIYQNVSFIKKYAPDYVLILSGDHIYRMDYSEMLKAHQKSRAVLTVATVRVPLAEAGRFGICSTSPDGCIYQFDEKPKQPKSNQASMGIYIFDTEVLLRYLEEDAQNTASSNDFGRDILPMLIQAGERVFAYPFQGYWKDVGTVQSLWDANMDLLGEAPVLNLSDGHFRVYSRNPGRSPMRIGEGARLTDTILSDGCHIEGSVEHSVLSCGVTVEEGAQIRHSVIMENVKVRKNAVVEYAIVDSDAVIAEGAHVGDQNDSNERITVIGTGKYVSADMSLLEVEG